MSYLVRTNCCGQSVTIEDASDPDGAVSCSGESAACCMEPHHHGQAANACPGGHGTSCGPGVDGCTVCRPLTIVALPDTVALVAETIRTD